MPFLVVTPHVIDFHYNSVALTHEKNSLNPSNAELNPNCRMLALLGAHHILHVSRIRVNCSFSKLLLQWGTAVAQWLRCCATDRKVAGLIPAGVSGFFIDIKSFRSLYGPGVDSAFNRNEYQEYFVRVKAVGAKS